MLLVYHKLMQKAITVTILNNQIKALLESHYINTTVTGEVSRVTYHSSGHLYFTLKDKNSSISCVMFKGNKRSLKFTLEDGMSVVLLGAVSVYTPRGSYQLNVISLEPEGSGALALAYEQLKEKLKEKGYFDSDIKKELPKFPKTIALITSKTGAALQDMLRVAQNRYPLVKLILLDTQVQGEGSCEMIVANIKKADSLKVDIIIVGRGGGSVEDLWAFNQERVADAIFEANTPIISAVGHEIDFLISDFCADVRASTPSNAIEIALADKSELLIMLDSYMDRFDEKLQNIIVKKLRDLDHLKELLKHSSPITKLTHIENEIQIISQNLNSTIYFILKRKATELEGVKNIFTQNNPSLRDKKGFAQVVKSGKSVDLETLESQDEIELFNSKVKIISKVVDKSYLAT